MQLDQITIALRPRPARQALDMGFALLHARAATVYAAWLALWLPLIAVAAALTAAMPDHAALWILLPWWFKPLLERAPLYVLSRQVFGEDVTWLQAVRAWPGQLGGGWVRMLTWWRPFMAGRGLYQPIWQLERARGEAAGRRRAVIGRDGAGRAAYMFGVACAHFEAVLQVGLLAFVGMFTSEDQFKILAYVMGQGNDSLAMQMLPLACYAVGGAIIGPMYIACCFTLYLNRRATLEAWDIELVLRQIHPPGERRTQSAAAWLLAPLAFAVAASLQAPPAQAADNGAGAPASQAANCASMPVLFPAERFPAHDAEQRALRDDVDQVYAGDDLRGYDCAPTWRLKGAKDQKQPVNRKDTPAWPLLAGILRAVLIASAIGACAWLLYRYRDRLLALLPRAAAPMAATEIAGLDIRAESLPADVTAQVRAQWERGERRNALALLYRATLSRLVQRHGLHLAQGATEGDCLRVAALAVKRKQFDDAGHAVMATVTQLWQEGAYAGRWPDSAAVTSACAAWDGRWRAPAGSAA
ncbi:DUF4129 domain-containing protein [Pseudoduganella ginsengisoli]|uniref:DUF4129 domain-containing protein n=1 Tax=Pseudoduganella ginsengisoli TaxID=1462440 RepID=A0A6L6Q7A5_9BURK|nr:DUF4129 domain-containing protein [Pseudoduganella ginsengisoli]MTW05108.1 DUF4129 domain-containing protein [Pseudoduganella ginsengisoli]